MKEIKEKLMELEDVLQMSEDEHITEDTLLEDIENYDSMTKMALLLFMEDEYGVVLEKEHYDSFKTVGDIIKLMED